MSRHQSNREVTGKLTRSAAARSESIAAGNAKPVLDRRTAASPPSQLAAIDPATAPAANHTGLPDALKAGVERLSGVSLDGVRVHRNSAKPAQLNAHAYAQGTEIHLAPGQERHLPHEAWHVVQQAQGRVAPTQELRPGVLINDDRRLEQEADAMGAKAVSAAPTPHSPESTAIGAQPGSAQHASSPGSTGQRVVQRIISGYPRGPLPLDAPVFEGLNSQQCQGVQQLHNALWPYFPNEARAQVGAAPLRERAPPMSFRYDFHGRPTEDVIEHDRGGLVVHPSGGTPQSWDAPPQISAAIGIGSADLPNDHRRAITQNQVMGASANEVARQAGFDMSGGWEWLHLVAFSIGQTHVGHLSPDSADLIERTGQVQQISENLVLGTAAANTEMLNWETGLKALLRMNPGWTVQLAVIAHRDPNFTAFPVAAGISYHFLIQTGPTSYIPPVVVEFDCQSHTRPASQSFQAVWNMLRIHSGRIVTLAQPLNGMDADAMDVVQNDG